MAERLSDLAPSPHPPYANGTLLRTFFSYLFSDLTWWVFVLWYQQWLRKAIFIDMDWYVWDCSGRWKYWMKVKGKIGLGFLDRKKHKPYQLFTFCRKLFESLISLKTTVKKFSFNNSTKTKFTMPVDLFFMHFHSTLVTRLVVCFCWQ